MLLLCDQKVGFHRPKDKREMGVWEKRWKKKATTFFIKQPKWKKTMRKTMRRTRPSIYCRNNKIGCESLNKGKKEVYTNRRKGKEVGCVGKPRSAKGGTIPMRSNLWNQNNGMNTHCRHSDGKDSAAAEKPTYDFFLELNKFYLAYTVHIHLYIHTYRKSNTNQTYVYSSRHTYIHTQ